jgi:putative endonuclease
LGVRDDLFFVYMMTNRTRSVLYTGVTNDLRRRVSEHQLGIGGVFTNHYLVHTLVYYETYPSVVAAITREKQIKSWNRKRKNKLVESRNPKWEPMPLG